MLISVDPEDLVAKRLLSKEDAQMLHRWAVKDPCLPTNTNLMNTPIGRTGDDQEQTPEKKRDIGSLALGIVMGFGAISLAAGITALLPAPGTLITAGILMAASAWATKDSERCVWRVFSNIMMTVGALTFGLGVVGQFTPTAEWCEAIRVEKPTNLHAIFLILAAVYAVGACQAKSGLLAALCAIAISGSIGAKPMTSDLHYVMVIPQPLLTIVAFFILGIASYRLSKTCDGETSRVVVIFSRTCVVLVNMGFWVGSLRGGGQAGWEREISWVAGFPSETLFAIVWAAALIVAGAWALKRNRRWLLNTCATFGAIHFYTQYFRYLGGSPGTLILAGILAIGIGLGMAKLNKEASLQELA